MTVSGPGSRGLTVIYEFDVEPEEQQPLRDGIEQLLRDVLSHRPGFVSAALHVSRDGGKALTTVRWESLEAFERFRDGEEHQSKIRPVITSYGPRSRVYDLVFVATGRADVPVTAPRTPQSAATDRRATDHHLRRVPDQPVGGIR
jgi:heme-degrading monooxygenase HmoA